MKVNLDTPVPYYRLQLWAAVAKVISAFGGVDESDKKKLGFENNKFTNKTFATVYHLIEENPPDFPLMNLILPILKMPAMSAVGIGATISGGLWYFWSHFNRAAKWK